MFTWAGGRYGFVNSPAVSEKWGRDAFLLSHASARRHLPALTLLMSGKHPCVPGWDLQASKNDVN